MSVETFITATTSADIRGDNFKEVINSHLGTNIKQNKAMKDIKPSINNVELMAATKTNKITS